MMLSFFACRECAAPIDARRKAALVAQLHEPVLLDLTCEACGLRALYETGTGPGRVVLNSAVDRA